MAERAWLLAHPAAVCYQAQWDEARVVRYPNLIALAGDIAVRADAQDGPGINGDVSDGHQEASALNQLANKAKQNCP
jgi:hypothetical protein